MVKEPESTYAGHVPQASGSNTAIAERIYDYITAEVSIELNHILALGRDGTPINT